MILVNMMIMFKRYGYFHTTGIEAIEHLLSMAGMASWLVHSPPDRALVGDIALCSWAKLSSGGNHEMD